MTLIKDSIYWIACWAAYRTYLMLPIDWRICWAVLPYAGLYAYNNTFADFRECAAWNRAGRPDDNVAREVAA